MATITYTGRGLHANAVQCDYGACVRVARVSVSALIQSEKNGLRFLNAIFQVCKKHEPSARKLLEGIT